MKKMPERIKSMLDSDDIELVQLGANLMREYVPKNKWESVLEMFSFESPETNYGQDIYIKKWDWKIEGEEIKIVDYSWSWAFPTFGTKTTTLRYIVEDYDTHKNSKRLTRQSEGNATKQRPGNGKARRHTSPRTRKK